MVPESVSSWQIHKFWDQFCIFSPIISLDSSVKCLECSRGSIIFVEWMYQWSLIYMTLSLRKLTHITKSKYVNFTYSFNLLLFYIFWWVLTEMLYWVCFDLSIHNSHLFTHEHMPCLVLSIWNCSCLNCHPKWISFYHQTNLYGETKQ